MTTISEDPSRPRRRRRLHSDEFKARAVASCMQPGMSMAAVAMAHGVNANLLRRWVREAEMKPLAGAISKTTGEPVHAPPRDALFLPVGLPAPTPQPQLADNRIELQRGATAITLTWPVSAAGDCAAWLHELLR
ncbi:transposase [Leptothrix discophora]|uniref:Transposase n=1 Tax=Leptothrix discophora TaxID=89 RepID=A0ABT9G8W2_LEPDI|nr:transposase [Leptothrix discophora]MDP4302923.1 transposase [Leptothrix discophora]